MINIRSIPLPHFTKVCMVWEAILRNQTYRVSFNNSRWLVVESFRAIYRIKNPPRLIITRVRRFSCLTNRGYWFGIPDCCVFRSWRAIAPDFPQNCFGWPALHWKRAPSPCPCVTNQCAADPLDRATLSSRKHRRTTNSVSDLKFSITSSFRHLVNK